MERKFHGSESSLCGLLSESPRTFVPWNFCTPGTFAPQELMFPELSLCPQERKFQGANVPWNESSTGAKVLSVDFSLPGTKVQRNEKAWNRLKPPNLLLKLRLNFGFIGRSWV